jgi:hypothetical protein
MSFECDLEKAGFDWGSSTIGVQGNCLDFHVCFSQFMATPSAL